MMEGIEMKEIVKGWHEMEMDEKVERLLDLYLDAREWRREESVLLSRFQREIADVRADLQQLRLETNGFSLKERLETLDIELKKIAESAYEATEKAG